MVFKYLDSSPLRAKIMLWAKSSKLSAAASGFPGRFNIKVSLMRPNVVGFPGFISILSKNISYPNASNASFVKSASPTLTPPEVMTRSQSSELLICA